MAAITRLTLDGYMGRRAGSFAGKAATAFTGPNSNIVYAVTGNIVYAAVFKVLKEYTYPKHSVYREAR